MKYFCCLSTVIGNSCNWQLLKQLAVKIFCSTNCVTIVSNCWQHKQMETNMGQTLVREKRWNAMNSWLEKKHIIWKLQYLWGANLPNRSPNNKLTMQHVLTIFDPLINMLMPTYVTLPSISYISILAQIPQNVLM